MAAAIALRGDFDGATLRGLAKRTRDAKQGRRLLALAEIYDGGERRNATRIGGVGVQIVRDWVVRFNAEGPEGLIDRKAPGQPPKLDAAHRRALARRIEAGPIPAVHGVVRWRLVDLIQWIWEEFRIVVAKQTLSRVVRSMGYRKLSARPRHYARNPAAAADFKKTFPPVLAEIARRKAAGTAIEVWFQDEARIGQKNKRTRRWARRGTRPSAPHDQRTQSAYIFGAICPAAGKGAGLVLPFCNTAAMQMHLDEISLAVAHGAHAVLLVDQAGWHTTAKLDIPANITIVSLPARSPELNPVENVWQFMRDNWLSNRVFDSFDDIVDHCCDAWNKLVDQPWRIMSLGLRDWAHRF
ncbi:MAG: IS630 family transposase [Pseudomonadota bacterium]